jgi:hypothetical protein
MTVPADHTVEPENIEGVVNGLAIPLQLGARITTQPNAGGSNPDTSCPTTHGSRRAKTHAAEQQSLPVSGTKMRFGQPGGLQV